MKENAFIYMAFGTQVSYRQCAFSVLTLLSTNTINGCVFIVTDNEQAVSSKVMPTEVVRYIVLTPGEFKALRGDIDFIHRIKIAVIELIAKKHVMFQRYIYIDSDTLICKDIHSIVNRITPEISLMHKHEFRFSDSEFYSADDQTKALLTFIRSNRPSIDVAKSRVNINENFSSWNAGVLGIHFANMKLLDGVYELTSLFFKAEPHHASEQFAFSFVLESQTQMITCENEVYHYWPKVQKEIADDFLKSFFSKWQKRPKDLQYVNDSRRRLEKVFTSHVYYYQDRAIKAFTSGDFARGFLWSVQALARNPFKKPRFMLDVLYYLKTYSLGTFKDQ